MQRILVVEDELHIRENLVWLLEASGYEALAAADGDEGIRMARQEVPALILCDVMMPGTDGFGVLRALQETPATAAIPFIFLTARTEREDIRAGMVAGADDYITKPFAADEVLEAIGVRLHKKASIEARHEGAMDELRSHISSALPHELRTPLAAVLGFTQLLLVEGAQMAPEVAHRMLKDIYRSARRLERTVESFHFFTQLVMLKSDAEAVAAWRRRCTPEAGGLVGEVVQRVAHEHRRWIDVRLHGGGGSAAVAADHLRNATAELVGNAFKFSEAGTPVTVRAGQEGEAFVLSVRDEGCGFRSDDAHRTGAFLQFGRAQREQQGSGLGLAIVRGIAELYGGAVEVDTAPGAGTTVRLTLPVPKPAEQRRAPVHVAPAA